MEALAHVAQVCPAIAAEVSLELQHLVLGDMLVEHLVQQIPEGRVEAHAIGAISDVLRRFDGSRDNDAANYTGHVGACRCVREQRDRPLITAERMVVQTGFGYRVAHRARVERAADRSSGAAREYSSEHTSTMEKGQVQLGIIGMGDMGRLYANKMRAGGWEHVNVCDRAENYESLRRDLEGTGICVFSDGHQVARRSDFCMFAVEAVNLDRVVAEYGPSMKVDAIVSGQSSVKAPEKAAYDKYLPDDVHIVSCHSLHGPNVDPAGQPMVIIRYRASDEKMQLAERILSSLGSRFVYMSYEEHDTITANTQATTHAAFLTMGTAWSMAQKYPWETGMYPGGIETVKINLCLRIYGAKWHVYAGLAILNPAAKTQVTQYARSATDMFKLMISGEYDTLVARVFAARRAVFGWRDDEDGEGATAQGPRRKPILMSDNTLDRFHMAAAAVSPHGAAQQPERTIPNSHLSLLAIADSWHMLGIDPYLHLELAATPIFRLWIGVTEYLFRSPTRLIAACRAALDHKKYRADDTEFVIAARGWAQAVQFGDYDAYYKRFEATRQFFEPRLAEANRVGAQMLKVLAAP